MADKHINAARKVVEMVTRSMGKGSVMLMGDSALSAGQVTSTGSIGLDLALGVEGIPMGRIVEIYGPEASGKTTLTLAMLANAQKAGLMGAFIDAEHALDPEYAGKIGVNLESLLIAQPDCGEDALSLCEILIRETPVQLIVVDSVAALVPRAEIAGEMGDQHMGLQARLMSQALRKLVAAAYKHQTTVIFINQLRMKIGNVYGSNETTTGGRALRFYTSIRLDVRRIASLKNGEEVYGSRVRVKTVKNKLAPPHRKAEFDILFGKGIDRAGEILDHALALDLCQQSGSWFSMNDQRLGQGRLKAIDYLEAHPNTLNELATAIRKPKAVSIPPLSTQKAA
jgi:recombination protein RecA